MGDGAWKAKMEKNKPPCHQNIQLRDEGVHPTAVSTVQRILHIYIYQIFPNNRMFVLKSPMEMSGKMVTVEWYFLETSFWNIKISIWKIVFKILCMHSKLGSRVSVINHTVEKSGRVHLFIRQLRTKYLCLKTKKVLHLSKPIL